MSGEWVAVLFCGELGLSSTDTDGLPHCRSSRLHLLCSPSTPSSLLPLSLSPLLHHHLALFRHCSLSRVIVVVPKKEAELVDRSIKDFLAAGEKENEKEEKEKEKEEKGMKVEMEVVGSDSCAADTLLGLEGRIGGGHFVIFNWDVLVSPSVVSAMIDHHRTRDALFTSLLLSPPPPHKHDPKAKPPPPPFSFDSLKVPNRTTVPPIHHYFALDQDRLLHVTPFEAGGEEEGSLRISISKVILRHFPSVTLNRSYLDCTLYICSNKVIQFIRENVDKMPRSFPLLLLLSLSTFSLILPWPVSSFISFSLFDGFLLISSSSLPFSLPSRVHYIVSACDLISFSGGPCRWTSSPSS
jgi:hypothetical protein